MRALVIGGTGPTGPPVVQGLLDRGYEVTIYHRGTHETDALPPVSHHLHGDPDSREQLEADFGASQWDLVVSMYGRLRFIAELMAGRCERFIAIGGKGGNVPPERLPFPEGRALPIDEGHPRISERNSEGADIGWAVAQTERDVLARHAAGDFRATVLRYTDLYGPRVPRQWLWSIVRRILDGRPHIIVPGDGSQLRTMCFTDNAAQQVLLAVDHAESGGEAFNAVDAKTYTLRDVIRIVADALGHDWEIVGITHPSATDFAAGYASTSQQFDSYKLRRLLEYEDVVPPAEGLRRTARWLAEHREGLDEAQLTLLVPDEFDYASEDRLIASHREWTEQIAAQLPKPTRRRALGPGFRAQFGAAPDG